MEYVGILKPLIPSFLLYILHIPENPKYSIKCETNAQNFKDYHSLIAYIYKEICLKIG